MTYRQRKLFKKIFSFYLALLLVLNPVITSVVLATDECPVVTETTSEEAALSSPSESEEPTPPPDSGSVTAETGGAQATTDVDTIANTNLTTIPGQVSQSDNPCDPLQTETGCPGDTQLSFDNQAEVADSATSSANTGNSQITGAAGTASLTSGDATASGSLNNTINSIITRLEPPSEATPSASEDTAAAESGPGESAPSDASILPPPSITIEASNSAILTDTADIDATTGENNLSQNGQALLVTGDALAYVNLVNLLNTNVVGSIFELFLLDLLQGQSGDINLNELSKKLLASEPQPTPTLSPATLIVESNNAVDLINDLDVNATSGDNQTNENLGSVSVQTGNATALANVINLANINLVGSQFFIGIINIMGNFVGNIILPRPGWFQGTETAGDLGASSDSGSASFENDNQASLNDLVTTLATTGGNQLNNNQGGSSLQTGNALSYARIFSLINTNVYKNNWFLFNLNNLGSWSGQILGWSSPDASETLDNQQPTVLQTGSPQNSGSETAGDAGQLGVCAEADCLIPPQPPSGTQIFNQNDANLQTDLKVTANTGANTASNNQGDVSLQTGNAKALANLFNLVNLNIFGSHWFLGALNILGDWKGNLIFAYPDVVVSLTPGKSDLTPGETTEFTLNYANQGYDDAPNATVQFDLPQDLTFLNDTSGQTPTVSGSVYSWSLGNLPMNQSGSFQIKVKVNPDFKFLEKTSFWSKIIPNVSAADEEKSSQVTSTAFINTTDPDEYRYNWKNNVSSASVIVYENPLPVTSSEATDNYSVDQNQPQLEITAWNNVNEFVYPGDVVTFIITIKNTGQATASDTVVTQELFNGMPEGFGFANFKIGEIPSGKTAKLTFGLKLQSDIETPDGQYRTVAVAAAYAPNGQKVTSNQAKTTFAIRLKKALINEVQAVKKEDEQEVVLAADDQNLECSTRTADNKPYLLVLLVSLLWLLREARLRWQLNQLQEKPKE